MTNEIEFFVHDFRNIDLRVFGDEPFARLAAVLDAREQARGAGRAFVVPQIKISTL
jgi:hypothetical protein